MNKYEELIYSLIYNCNREVTTEEMKILNQAGAIYNTYNQLTEQLGCPLDVIFKALKNGAYLEIKGNTISDNIMVYHKNVSVVKNEIQFQRTDESCIYIIRRLEDYQKTWWLREDKSE